MSEQLASPNAATGFDHDSTLVAALELSGRSWELGAVVPGLARRPRRRLEPRDLAGLVKALQRWTSQAVAAGCTVERVVLTYEAGRDGFWLARALQARGIEVQVMHPASIPVPRRGRRAKTDRIDLDMLLRTILAWLRGEPRVCTMAPIPSEAEEDLRRPGRERERLVRERVQLENRIESLLALHGIAGFKPRLKRAAEQLDAAARLRRPATAALCDERAAPAAGPTPPGLRPAQGDRSRARPGAERCPAEPRGADDPVAGPLHRARRGDGAPAGARGAVPKVR